MKLELLTYEKENLPVRESLIYHGDYTIQGGVRGIEKLVADNPDMTAVFVTNYEMTMGAVIGMNELDLKIPEQLSMIGLIICSLPEPAAPSLPSWHSLHRALPGKWRALC